MRHARFFLLGLVLGLPLLSAQAQTLTVLSRQPLTQFAWTPEETTWIHDHAGLIFFNDGTQPNYTMSELIDQAHALGLKKVKTWLKGEQQGQMLQVLATPLYQRILTEFDTVLFDVCPDFMPTGPFDAAHQLLVSSDYESVAYYLASHYRDAKKTFLLSLFMETNLFFSLEGTRWAEWPADQFFNVATAAVQSGIARAKREGGTQPAPKIYTVIEVGGLPKDYIKRYLPNTHADLYALSYYGRGELGQPDCTLLDSIQTLAAYVPHDGPFGQNNLILGELGRNVFGGGHEGEDLEQIQYLQMTLGEARANQFAFAFIFWINDQDRSWDDGWGFISSKNTGGYLRRSWHAFQGIFGGQMPAGRPALPHAAIEAVRAIDANPKTGHSARVEIDVANRSTWSSSAAQATAVAIGVQAGHQNLATSVTLAPDELVTLQAQVTAPSGGTIGLSLSGPGLAAQTTTSSLNRADLVVDRVYSDPAQPKAGDQVRFYAAVRNLGNAPITNVAVHFHIDDFKALWYTWGCFYDPSFLAKGQTFNIAGDLWPATGGMHQVRAWVNPDGSRESNYDNNITVQEFDIPPLNSSVAPSPPYN